jgi:hypothetical protein
MPEKIVLPDVWCDHPHVGSRGFTVVSICDADRVCPVSTSQGAHKYTGTAAPPLDNLVQA